MGEGAFAWTARASIPIEKEKVNGSEARWKWKLDGSGIMMELEADDSIGPPHLPLSVYHVFNQLCLAWNREQDAL